MHHASEDAQLARVVALHQQASALIATLSSTERKEVGASARMWRAMPSKFSMERYRKWGRPCPEHDLQRPEWLLLARRFAAGFCKRQANRTGMMYAQWSPAAAAQSDALRGHALPDPPNPTAPLGLHVLPT